MADSQTVVSLNIGSQRVSMGVFSLKGDGGLVLRNYETTTILADPSADAARIPQVKLAVADLSKRLGISKSKVNYSVSGQSVFTRFVKLPAIGGDDLEQLVEFEARQHVPFPLEEVVWSWSEVGSGATGDVVLVAIKSDQLDSLNDAIEESKHITGVVDTSPMALYESFAYNYNDVEEPCLLIDVGAKTSNLIYIEGTRVFVRSIAVGGAAVTTAVSKEYGVTYEEAESQKCSNGLVALDTRHTSGLDELTAGLAACIRTSLNRMPAEIARTTNFYRSQHGGSAPKKVFIAGGGANLKNFASFLQEKLRLDVEYFNPLRRVSVGSGVDVDQVSADAHMLGELVGLSLRASGQGKLSVDLTPSSVESERADQKRKPFLIAASTIFLVSLAALALSGKSKVSQAEDEVTKIDSSLSSLKSLAGPIERSRAAVAKLDQVGGQYVEAQESRVYWLEIANDLKQQFADKSLWLVDFSPVSGYSPLADKLPKDLIKDGFNTSSKSKSMLLKVDMPVSKNPRIAPPLPKVNAVKVKGFWHGRSGAANVSRLLKNLRDNSKHFTFEVQVSSRPVKFEVLKTEDIIISNTSTLEDGAYAGGFELILPLKQPLTLK